MCVIVDTNVACLLLDKGNEDFRPVFDWITDKKKPGRLVLGGTLEDELNIPSALVDFLSTLNQAGRLVKIRHEAVDSEIEQIKSIENCCSNDIYIIALARLSGARLLCSLDRDLGKDFKNKKFINNPRGKIIKNRKHRRHLGHVSSCLKNCRSNNMG